MSAPIGGGASCTCAPSLLRLVGDLRTSVDHGCESVDERDCVERPQWAELFARYFSGGRCAEWQPCAGAQCSGRFDDMLWYVKRDAQFYLGTHTSPLEVHRRESGKRPLPHDPAVNWEESVYLNLILQQLEYTVTVAVCTKTSPSNLQILRKNSQRVWASPSRRRMDAKGESEEIAYPSIYFAVDDFEQVFADVAVRDGECVCVELAAQTADRRTAVFLGSIRYEVLKQVYDAKASKSWGAWGIQRLVASGQPNRRQEFVRMRGPHGKGYAEMAVAKVAGLGFETPLTESAYDQQQSNAYDYDQQESMRQRRMSDTHLNRHVSYKSLRTGPTGNGVSASNPVKPCQSESDYMNQYPEVDANTLDDELDECNSGLWSVRGFNQAWHWLRERKRAASAPLNAYLTYVTLPWANIVQDLLSEKPRQPVLTFEVDRPSVGKKGDG